MKLLDAIVKRTNGCAMFEFRNNGKVYWLFNHHTKLNPHKDALRVNLGKCIRPRHKYVHMNGDYLYLTHTLQETISRNEASEKLNNKINKKHAGRKSKQPPIAGTSWDKSVSANRQAKRSGVSKLHETAKKVKEKTKKGKQVRAKKARRHTTK